jgi:hypothetical protein
VTTGPARPTATEGSKVTAIAITAAARDIVLEITTGEHDPADVVNGSSSTPRASGCTNTVFAAAVSSLAAGIGNEH